MKFKIFAIIFIAVLLGACRTATVYEVKDAAVVSNAPKISKDDVRKAIVRAGSGLGWQIKDNGPNALIGTLMLRDHVAIVDIPYSEKHYSINYKNSTNLNYDGTTIHSNYNGWVQNLSKAINVQLGTM
jgi:hypothetical protein